VPVEPIDLDRELAPLPERDEFGADWDRALAQVSRRLWTWRSVPGRVVVLLGEAGTGKSTELELLVRRSPTDHPSFVFQLAELVPCKRNL